MNRGASEEDVNGPAVIRSAVDEPLLRVADLTVALPTEDGVVSAVRGLNYDLHTGEVLAIVGESGSGKSVSALAVVGLLPQSAQAGGSIRFGEQELIGASESRMRQIRGRRIAMIFQDPMSSLHPTLPVGYQIAEAVREHSGATRGAAFDRAVELLSLMGVPRARERARQHPHEFSGGMCQRAVIAIAMANDPEVIIADEPTTALDVTVQAEILDVLATARANADAAMVLITHDLGVVAGRADRVLVMYAGKPVELGSADDIFYRSRMPYTLGLVGSVPRLDRSRLDGSLTPIGGSPPSLIDPPPGCSFEPRCPMRQALCTSAEPKILATTSDRHTAACHFSADLQGLAPQAVFPTTHLAPAVPAGVGERDTSTADPLLSVRRLVKHYPVRGKGILRRRLDTVHAVCDVSFDLYEQETLGLVGESGCGKTTLARTLLGLQSPTSGEVTFRGENLSGRTRLEMRRLRSEMQLVFQDPFSSLDPRMTVGDAIGEPLRIHGRHSDDRDDHVRDLMAMVGLNPEHASRYPHEFSGGQRQRVGVARALALEPALMVLDEPVSALDVSIQAGVLNLLADLQERLGLAYVLVSHDLSVVRYIADRIAVMHLGRIIEIASSDELFASPAHPYTQALISAIPLADPRKELARQRIAAVGELPSPSEPPNGCRFRSRCSKFADHLSDEERKGCVETEPELVDHGQGHPSACHYAETVRVV